LDESRLIFFHLFSSSALRVKLTYDSQQAAWFYSPINFSFSLRLKNETARGSGVHEWWRFWGGDSVNIFCVRPRTLQIECASERRCQNTVCVTLRFRSNTLSLQHFHPNIVPRGVNSAFLSAAAPPSALFLKQIALCECYWRDWCRRVISFSAKCIQIQPFASCGAGSPSV
jgi:hypothetical protein